MADLFPDETHVRAGSLADTQALVGRLVSRRSYRYRSPIAESRKILARADSVGSGDRAPGICPCHRQSAPCRGPILSGDLSVGTRVCKWLYGPIGVAAALSNGGHPSQVWSRLEALDPELLEVLDDEEDDGVIITCRGMNPNPPLLPPMAGRAE